MSVNKILKLGLKEAEYFNCSKNLNVGKESEDELRMFNKIYYRCPSCEYFSKIHIIGDGRILIREA